MHNRFVWIENSELLQEFLSFSRGIRLLQDDVAAHGACYDCKKLNDGSIRQTNRAFGDAAPENLGCNLLLFGKTVSNR